MSSQLRKLIRTFFIVTLLGIVIFYKFSIRQPYLGKLDLCIVTVKPAPQPKKAVLQQTAIMLIRFLESQQFWLRTGHQHFKDRLRYNIKSFRIVRIKTQPENDLLVEHIVEYVL